MPEKKDLDTRIEVLVYGQRTVRYTTQELPTRNALLKLPPLEQIDVVCQRYKLWILDFAKELAERPDTGYAILAMLNSYFDMIASLSGYNPKGKDATGKRVKWGLSKVFPELQKYPKIADELYNRLRNPMAHMGMTKDLIVTFTPLADPIEWGRFRNQPLAIFIDPRLWAKRICDHFDDFTARLLDPDPKNEERRTNFLDRIANPP